jgi:hypothetical protein
LQVADNLANENPETVFPPKIEQLHIQGREVLGIRLLLLMIGSAFVSPHIRKIPSTLTQIPHPTSYVGRAIALKYKSQRVHLRGGHSRRKQPSGIYYSVVLVIDAILEMRK